MNRVFCGAQFSVALTVDGEVYTWGKGDHYRLGHGSEEHLRYPKKMNGLKGEFFSQFGGGGKDLLFSRLEQLGRVLQAKK